MGKRFILRQGIAWFFVQKVHKPVKSSQKYLLFDIVHINEFMVGGKEDGRQGRSMIQ